MKTYGELNLKKIREECDLDFAHYTYKPGMCSCCYGPSDLASIYWKHRIVRDDSDYKYILFKNADNGSGHVTRNDIISGVTTIEYGNITMEEKIKVAKMLKEQLDDDYLVFVPKTSAYCIAIVNKVNCWESQLKNFKEDERYIEV